MFRNWNLEGYLLFIYFRYVDINTGLESFYCPEGPYLHIPPIGPNSAFESISFESP